jgi:hypothetical protein
MRGSERTTASGAVRSQTDQQRVPRKTLRFRIEQSTRMSRSAIRRPIEAALLSKAQPDGACREQFLDNR